MEDYTSKYKGEQVEVALFGGDYHEGVLTAYCAVDEVAHIELNGHILIPLAEHRLAPLHEPVRRARARLAAARLRRGRARLVAAVGFLPTARNLLKAWLLLLGFCAIVGGLAWWIGGYRTASLSIFCVLLAAAALYWYLDRVAPGMVGAREMALAEGSGASVDR